MMCHRLIAIVPLFGMLVLLLGGALTGSGTEESVARITRDSLVDYHDTWFRPNNATMIVQRIPKIDPEPSMVIRSGKL